jgi:hypothetical protein
VRWSSGEDILELVAETGIISSRSSRAGIRDGGATEGVRGRDRQLEFSVHDPEVTFE